MIDDLNSYITYPLFRPCPYTFILLGDLIQLTVFIIATIYMFLSVN